MTTSGYKWQTFVESLNGVQRSLSDGALSTPITQRCPIPAICLPHPLQESADGCEAARLRNSSHQQPRHNQVGSGNSAA